MAALLYAVLYFSAPIIASFYNIPLLRDVLRVQGVILFIYAFNIVQRNQLRKRLNFRALSMITISSSIISLTITIFMAYQGYGVWSLVAQNIFTAIIPALVFWFYIKWRPSWTFSWKSFSELFSFGFYMFLTHLLNQFGQQIQGLLIGRFYNASTMGYYSKAHSTEKLASISIDRVMNQVTYPLYAEAQDDNIILISIIKRITMILSYITFPLMFILLLCAKPIFVLLYSDRWLQSVPYFQVLCLAGLAYCLQAVNNQSVAAIGKSRAMFVWTIIRRAISIFLIIGGLMSFGMKGLLIGVVIGTWSSYLIHICLVSKYVGYKWTAQLLNIMPVGFVSIACAIIAYSGSLFFKLPLYSDGIIKLSIYVVLYIGWSILFKPEAFLYTKSIVSQMLSKFRNRKYKHNVL